MKNESMNIVEWIEHYEWQGIDHIFLIDNGSSDDTLQKVEPWIKSGFLSCSVEIAPHRQLAHYKKVFNREKIKQHFEWLLIADLDEFWYSPKGSLKQYLTNADRTVDVIYSPWKNFGSSGLDDHPHSIRKSLIQRCPDSATENTKWMCRTAAIVSADQIGIHKVYGVDSSRALFDVFSLCLNHYVIQSKRYFQTVKMTRGDVASVKFENVRDWDYFLRYDSAASIIDTELADQVSMA